ncbi:hypothetical protein BSKO_09257 [Bryopsis sp. KO-2023]|nr:hypothetical protein BSKO_09257 [Bryopsis sp. KO-2023]
MNLQLSNPFAALEHKKAKKKKEKSEREKRKKDKKDTLELEKAIFDQPQINVSSWADCDDEDDWAAEPTPQASENTNGAHVVEADSDHEIIDLEEEFGVELGGDDHHDNDHVDEKEDETEKVDVPAPLPKRKSVPVPVERQLSKKELKKKEMDELNAVLAELGIDSGGKEEDSESKNSKKKKKKGKAGEAVPSKTNGVDEKEADVDPPKAAEEEKPPTPDPEEPEEEESGIEGEIAIDALKAKMALKKKSSKKGGSASSLAAAEAKARAKKKGSKKDKSKFNQAPTRN